MDRVRCYGLQSGVMVEAHYHTQQKSLGRTFRPHTSVVGVRIR